MAPAPLTPLKKAVAEQMRWLSHTYAYLDRADMQEVLLGRAQQAATRVDRISQLAAEAESLDLEDETAVATVAQLNRDADQAMDWLGEIERRAEEIRASRRGERHDGDRKPHLKGVIGRLPHLEIPAFSGAIDEWPAFINLFDSLVHGRDDLDNAYKMAQLVMALRDEPRELVGHLTVTSANYLIARTILLERYQHTRRLVDAQLGRLFSIPRVTRDADIRSLVLNPVLVATKALKNLGLPVDQWSYIIFYMVLSRLPAGVQSRFEQLHGGSSTELPTLLQLTQFLETECRRHDTLEPEPSVSRQPTRSRESPRPPPPRGGGRPKQYGGMNAAPSGNGCAHCDSPGHSVSECALFKALGVNARRKLVFRHRLCFGCMGQHNMSECSHALPCECCGGRHHILLCLARPGSPYGHGQGRTQVGRPQGPTRAGPSPPPGNGGHLRGDGATYGRGPPRGERGSAGGSARGSGGIVSAVQGRRGLRPAGPPRATGGCRTTPTSGAKAGSPPPSAPPCPSLWEVDSRMSPPFLERPRLDPLSPIYPRCAPGTPYTVRYGHVPGQRGAYYTAWDPMQYMRSTSPPVACQQPSYTETDGGLSGYGSRGGSR